MSVRNFNIFLADEKLINFETMDTYDILEIYIKACELVDTNTKNQVELDKSRFVLFYNKAQLDYLREIISNLRSVDHVQRAQQFLSRQSLTSPSSLTNCFKYTLPQDYILKENVIAFALKQGCTGNFRMTLEEAKPSDVDYWFTDECRKPSFEFRESYYYVGDNGIYLYHDGSFTYGNVELIYYRHPQQVDIIGYEKENGTSSTNIQTEWSRIDVDAILDLMILEYSRAQLPIKAE